MRVNFYYLYKQKQMNTGSPSHNRVSIKQEPASIIPSFGRSDSYSSIKRKKKATIYQQKLERAIENIKCYHEMFGHEIKSLGPHYIEAAHIARNCAQHDQFLITQHSRDELNRLENSKKRMVSYLAQKFDFRVSFEDQVSPERRERMLSIRKGGLKAPKIQTGGANISGNQGRQFQSLKNKKKDAPSAVAEEEHRVINTQNKLNEAKEALQHLRRKTLSSHEVMAEIYRMNSQMHRNHDKDPEGFDKTLSRADSSDSLGLLSGRSPKNAQRVGESTPMSPTGLQRKISLIQKGESTIK